MRRLAAALFLVAASASAGGQRSAGPRPARTIAPPGAPAPGAAPTLGSAPLPELGPTMGLQARPPRASAAAPERSRPRPEASAGGLAAPSGNAAAFAASPAPVERAMQAALRADAAAEPASAAVAAVRAPLSDPQASAPELAQAGSIAFDGAVRKGADGPESAFPPSRDNGQGGGRVAARLSRYQGKLARGASGVALAFGGAAVPLGQALSDGGSSPAGWAAAALGLALGMRHALDPDHVIALLNLAAGARSKWAGWKLGALWGLGHSLALLVVGGGLVLTKAAMPETWAAGLESIVALMLIGLGAAAIAREGRAAAHGHYHDLERLRLRPLAIGLVHGLAGSGAVALLALAAVPGASAGLLYLAAFGVGTIAGMTVVTFFVQALAARLISDPKVRGRVAMAAGAASALFGAYMLLELVPKLLGS